jgi:L-ascorbate metabolism protein UlaG (beta-lactamase superfamily)
MRRTHLGHVCLLVETDGARLLFDPGVLSAFSPGGVVRALPPGRGHDAVAAR